MFAHAGGSHWGSLCPRQCRCIESVLESTSPHSGHDSPSLFGFCGHDRDSCLCASCARVKVRGQYLHGVRGPRRPPPLVPARRRARREAGAGGDVDVDVDADVGAGEGDGKREDDAESGVVSANDCPLTLLLPSSSSHSVCSWAACSTLGSGTVKSAGADVALMMGSPPSTAAAVTAGRLRLDVCVPAVRKCAEASSTMVKL